MKHRLVPTCEIYHSLFLSFALKEVGQKEIRGSDHNPRIVEYHKAVDGEGLADEIAWCAAFVNWTMKQMEFHGTGTRLARDFLHWGIPIAKPFPGCVAVFSRGKQWQGHVGLYLYETPKTVVIVGGNQSNQVSVVPYSKERFLGYRSIF